MGIKGYEFVDTDGEVVDLDEIEQVVNENDEVIMEEGESHKKSHIEKKTLSMREKLLKLKAQLKDNPPKTMLGKKLAMARINRLENMMKKQIAKLAQRRNIEATRGMASEKEYEEYEAYVERDGEYRDKIAKAYFDKEGILRELVIAEGYDPKTGKYIYSKDDKRVEKNAPKGYTPKENVPNTELQNYIAELYEQLEGIEAYIEESKAQQAQNHMEYEAGKKQRSKSLRNELAVVKPNIFKRIKGAIQEKIGKASDWIEDKKGKVSKWIEDKRTETENKYNDTVSKAEENDVKRDEMLGSLYAGISLEEQKAKSAEVLAEIEAKKTGPEQPVIPKENEI